ncbi:hypothetical protein FACS1894180_8440 [Bacteroidia bacterium]|nr:hypothetical protein FACS1894180_8440 [Bacteroidia bacterium]
MKTLKEISGNYPNIDSTNVLSNQDMNRVLGGDDCKNCGAGCKSGCSSSGRTGDTKQTMATNLANLEFAAVVTSVPTDISAINFNSVELNRVAVVS